VKHRILFIFLLSLAITNIGNLLPKGEVLGISIQNVASAAEFDVRIKTETAFDQKDILEYETIPFETKYIDNSEKEYGTEEILVEGVDGIRTLTYLLTHWEEDIIDKQLINTAVDAPITEEISKGTKIVWREYMTPDVGGVNYWYKLRVWATKYDANCYGCTGKTYSGTEVKKGVCATDPRVIPLGTNFYVDGYGLCRAEDIGGAIKGNDVDLGFVDASKAAWGAAYTDIYLLTNVPE